MDLGEALIVAGILSAIVTKLVDTVRNVFDAGGKFPKWVWNLLAFGLGLTICWTGNVNLFATIQQIIPALGITFSGIGIGAGASGVHEFFDFLSSKAKEAKGTKIEANVPPGSGVDMQVTAPPKKRKR